MVVKPTEENRVLQERLIITRESEVKMLSIKEELELEVSNLKERNDDCEKPIKLN
jgi:hypothetical protein